MRINSFFYTIGQGFKNLGRNKWYTLASIATIGACLFLFGLFFSLINNIQHFVHTAEEGVSVTVFFDEGTSEDQMLAVKSEIEKGMGTQFDEKFAHIMLDMIAEDTEYTMHE